MATDTKAQILSTAQRLFTEQGYEATSLREIADELGFTKAALYYHFRAKEDIFVALVEPLLAIVDQLLDRLEAAESIQDWRDELDWVVGTMIANFDTFRLLQRNRTAVTTFAMHEEVFNEHMEMHVRVEKVVARVGKDLSERVRMVAALAAVTGLDDWAPMLVLETDPDELGEQLTATVHDILHVPKKRSRAKRS